MTQVNNINENLVIQTDHRSATSTGTGFQGSLEAAMTEETPTSPENGQAAALSEPQAAHFNPVSGNNSADDIAAQTDGLLVLLESYVGGLGSQNASLKDLAPLMDQIRDGAQQLMSSTEKNEDIEEGLKGIAAETILAANTEYIKFQRGDYL